MARINIEERVFREQGFQDLMIAVQSRHLAKGVVVELFQLAQEFWFPSRQLIPLDRFEAAGLPAVLYAPGGLAEKRENGIYVRGSEDAFLWLFQKQAGGETRAKTAARNKDGSFKRKTKKSIQQPTSTAGESSSTSQHPPGSLLSSLSSSLSSLDQSPSSNSFLSSDGVDDQPSADDEKVIALKRREENRATREAFVAAYVRRYGVEPTGNAKFNANIADFVKRVGAKDAPHIAEFYVNHNDSFYVRKTHAFGLALADAETLRTQWLRGRAVTSNDVRQFERADHTRSQLDRIERGEA